MRIHLGTQIVTVENEDQLLAFCDWWLQDVIAIDGVVWTREQLLRLERFQRRIAA